MSDTDTVLESNRGFYRAFESLDIEEMEHIWLKDPRIVCVHPGWGKLTGWGPIMASWERIFDNVFEMKFEISVIDVRVSGDLGVVVVEEELTQRGYDGAAHAKVLSANVFERSGTRWWMVLHHGSPIIATPGDEPPLQ